MGRNILVLCKVVDNFGDIGVVYRLSKALCDARPSLSLSLAVSDLRAFKAMCPAIDGTKPVQSYSYTAADGSACEWRILDWSICADEARKAGADSIPVVLECFQCGRPEWLESILFSDSFSRTVHIVNIDYLTAEEYADDFHLLKSGTRKTCIKKVNFMPGFTERTGGLIFGRAPRKRKKSPFFDILFFSYERGDFLMIVRAVASVERSMRECDPSFRVRVRLAAGRGAAGFLSAWRACGKPFPLETLDFLAQEEWDSLVASSDVSFVRGEDSLSRACLAGVPFVWHAYVQDGGYQLVKVNALLSRMEPFFAPSDFEPLRRFWNCYNGGKADGAESSLKEILLSAARGTIQEPFRAFSAALRKNGALEAHLLSYLDSLPLPR